MITEQQYTTAITELISAERQMGNAFYLLRANASEKSPTGQLAGKVRQLAKRLKGLRTALNHLQRVDDPGAPLQADPVFETDPGLLRPHDIARIGEEVASAITLMGSVSGLLALISRNSKRKYLAHRADRCVEFGCRYGREALATIELIVVFA